MYVIYHLSVKSLYGIYWIYRDIDAGHRFLCRKGCLFLRHLTALSTSFIASGIHDDENIRVSCGTTAADFATAIHTAGNHIHKNLKVCLPYHVILCSSVNILQVCNGAAGHHCLDCPWRSALRLPLVLEEKAIHSLARLLMVNHDRA